MYVIALSSIEKDFKATTGDSFKGCIFACKIINQIHTNYEKRNVSQAVSANLLKNAQYLFLYLGQKFLKNTFEVVHT